MMPFKSGLFCLGLYYTGIFYSFLLIVGKFYGNRNSGVSYTRVVLTENYRLSGMKSLWDDLIARTKTGRGCYVLASFSSVIVWAGNRTIIQKNKIKDDVLGIPEFI
jgi:hypothetical protein